MAVVLAAWMTVTPGGVHAQATPVSPPPAVFQQPFDPAPQIAPAVALPQDLSPLGMYRAADPVVKAVMIGLVLASILTWTVLLAKLLQLLGARTSLRRALARLAGAKGLGDVGVLTGPAANMRDAALDEMAAGVGLPVDGIKDRLRLRLSRLEAAEARRMARGTGLLATIGAVAPFVGLFGTVWGIMNAFIGISRTQTTNLAVVAPGIAEALLATALGLVAAIPAVVIYNLLARATTGYRAGLMDAAAAVDRLAGRDLDRGA